MRGCDCCKSKSLILHEVVYKKDKFVFFCPDCYWKLKAQFDTVIEAFLNEHNIICKVEDMKKGGAEE